MCIYCGKLFKREPICFKCYEDPEMRDHTCDFDECIIEGDCGGSSVYPDDDPKLRKVPNSDLREQFRQYDGIAPGIGSG